MSPTPRRAASFSFRSGSELPRNNREQHVRGHVFLVVDGLLSRHAPGALAKPFARVQVAVEAREVTRADLEPDPVPG